MISGGGAGGVVYGDGLTLISVSFCCIPLILVIPHCFT